jgi:hypothetical protein
MSDRETGVVLEEPLKHEGEAVRQFYAAIPPPVAVEMDTTGSMGWFLRLMELAIECRVGIRWRFARRRRGGRNTIGAMRRCCRSCWWRIGFRRSGCRRRSFAICGRSFCRHQWVRMRTRVQNALHAIALAHAVRRDPDQRFYRRKVAPKGFAKARVAAARRLGIRLRIMMRNQIDYAEFCRRGPCSTTATCLRETRSCR